MDTQTQIDRLIELAIIQRSELKQLVEQLPQLREHLNAEVEKVFDETEPQLRAELEEWTTKQTADKTAALGVALEAKIADLAKGLEVSTQARYNAIIAEREENARLAAQAEAKIAEHAASLPSAVKEIVSAELARFPRAGEIDQLRKEFAEPRGLNPRGKWQAGETYNRLDLVTVNGDSFVSNIDGNKERPSRSATNWTLNAARGMGGGSGFTSLNNVLGDPSAGQIVGSEGGQYVRKTLVAGANITINETANAITIIGDEGQISLQDGTAAAPSLFFTNDTDTGIYRPAANTLGISVSGTQVAYFDENGLTVPSAGVVAGGSIHAGNGNANNPSLSFDGDQDTGFFRHQPNEIGIALGGTQYATLTSTTFSITPVVTMASSLRVNGTTDSSNKDTGAIVTEGGLGVEKSASIGGNLTVNGTGTSSFAGPVTGTSSTNGYQWTLTGSGIGGPSIALDATNATVANRYSGLTLYSGGTFQWGLQLRAGDGKFHIYDGVRGADALTVDVGPSSGVAGTTTLAGNLTVSGTGTSSFAGTVNSNVGLRCTATNSNLSLYKDGTPSKAARVILNGSVADGLSLGLYNGTSWTDTLHISTNNNVLIGTTTDSGNGKLQLATHTTSAGGIGFGTADSFYTAGVGDFRFKTTSAEAAVTLLSGGAYIGSVTAGKSTFIVSGSGSTALTLDSSQNATFAGFILNRTNNKGIYTGTSDNCGFTWTGTNGEFSTASGSLILKSAGTTALTLDSSQNATFAGRVRAGTAVGTAKTVMIDAAFTTLLNVTKTFTVTMPSPSLASSFVLEVGVYGNTATGYASLMVKGGGYLGSSTLYEATELTKINSGSVTISSVTKASGSMTFTVINTSSSGHVAICYKQTSDDVFTTLPTITAV